MRRNNAVLYCSRINGRSVVVIPCDRVCSLGRCELCSVGNVVGHSGKRIIHAVGICSVRPSGEGITVLCCRFLRWNSSVIRRSRAVLYFLIRLENRSVLVLPRYRVLRKCHSPLGVQNRILSNGIGGEVPCIAACCFFVPSAEFPTVRSRSSGFGSLLTGFDGLISRRFCSVTVQIKRHGE